MDNREISEELRLHRERLHGLADDINACLNRTAVLEIQMRSALDRFVDRESFTPVQRIVYGLAASIMGAFIMAVATLVFKAIPK